MTLNLLRLFKPVYGRAAPALLACVLLQVASPSQAAVPAAGLQTADVVLTEARDALRRKDRVRLAALRTSALAAQHPLAMWADYWELTNRIAEVQQPEVTAFATRWSGTYVEDRLRNDWLLELGKRRDFANFAAEYPRFRMSDDREVSCYSLLLDQRNGKDVREAALAAWLAQRDADDGCTLMAGTLFDAKVFTPADIWRKARFALDANRPRAARVAVGLMSPEAANAVSSLSENPARYLMRSATAASRAGAELATLALIRMATNDPEAAAGQLSSRWDRALPPDLSAWVWAMVGKQAALKLQPEAADHFQRAAQRSVNGPRDAEWPDETLAWKVRAALRADNGRPRWKAVTQAVSAMAANDQRDSAWAYWNARAQLALASDTPDGEAQRAAAREQLKVLAGQLNFYGSLAAEHLGQPVFMPARPVPLTPAERAAAEQNPGLTRALQLIAIGLRGEGVREWNFALRGMGDRQLLAAAQLACDREVWDRCINTSDRTRVEIDMAQRFPTPFRKEVTAHASQIGLDPAYVYGLIRQESRFIMDARSGVGASGLMQVMPATARWTAKRIGLPYTADLLADRDTNLRIGTAYLKLVLDEFGGSQALAAAAYNAGPGRPRKWRDGPTLDAAVWAENIPFAETRDYVKKVLSNGTYYAALLTGQPPSLKVRLGRSIAPADPKASVLVKDLP